MRGLDSWMIANVLSRKDHKSLFRRFREQRLHTAIECAGVFPRKHVVYPTPQSRYHRGACGWDWRQSRRPPSQWPLLATARRSHPLLRAMPGDRVRIRSRHLLAERECVLRMPKSDRTEPEDGKMKRCHPRRSRHNGASIAVFQAKPRPSSALRKTAHGCGLLGYSRNSGTSLWPVYSRHSSQHRSVGGSDARSQLSSSRRQLRYRSLSPRRFVTDRNAQPSRFMRFIDMLSHSDMRAALVVACSKSRSSALSFAC